MHIPPRIRIFRSSALAALAAAGLAFPFIGIMELFRSNVSSEPLPKMILVAVPLLMASVTFVFTLVGCALYNGIRKIIGGSSQGA